MKEAFRSKRLISMGDQTDFQQIAVDLRQQVQQALDRHGPEHSDVARALSNLGNAEKSLGRLDDAKLLHLKAVQIYRTACGERDPRVAAALTNLGIVQKELGELEEAKASQELAVAIFLESLGPAEVRLATAYGNLGTVLKDLGRLEEAKDKLQQAVSICEAVQGPPAPSLVPLLVNLGNVLFELGELEEAGAGLERALAILGELPEPRGLPELQVATALNNLGSMAIGSGDYSRAKTLLGSALATYQRCLPSDHRRIADVLTNLGVAFKNLGESDEAEAAWQRALQVSLRAYGDDHALTSLIRHNLDELSKKPQASRDPGGDPWP
jgi:tetratricopeptide (TPR) repeat protein